MIVWRTQDFAMPRGGVGDGGRLDLERKWALDDDDVAGAGSLTGLLRIGNVGFRIYFAS